MILIPNVQKLVLMFLDDIQYPSEFTGIKTDIRLYLNDHQSYTGFIFSLPHMDVSRCVIVRIDFERIAIQSQHRWHD